MKQLLIKDCRDCLKPYVADEDWQRVCLICWKEASDYTLTKGDKAFGRMQDALIEIRDAGAGGAHLTQARIRDLLLLCHPDRHQNNARSNEITKWLLAMRKAGT